MKRGELWVGMGAGYASKPRPMLVVQSDLIDSFESAVVCLITSDELEGALTRVKVEPSPSNGLMRSSWVMTDKLFSFKPTQFRERIGELTDGEMEQVSEQLRRVLGL